MPVFLFFDESGDLNFSPIGSKYYFFGVLTTQSPSQLTNALNELRYSLYEDDLGFEYFHASEDRQAVRNQVFNVISSVGEFEFDSIIIEKSKANPVFRDEKRFYPQFANYLLAYVFKRYRDLGERVILITDRLPVKKKRKAVEKTFKSYIARNLGSRPYSILHHSSAAHACLQAADYCMWAVQRKWRNNDERSFKLIEQFVQSEFDIFQYGKMKYY